LSSVPPPGAAGCRKGPAVTGFQLAGAIKKLSSRLRINRASDDPAALVISEQLRSRIASATMENNPDFAGGRSQPRSRSKTCRNRDREPSAVPDTMQSSIFPSSHLSVYGRSCFWLAKRVTSRPPIFRSQRAALCKCKWDSGIQYREAGAVRIESGYMYLPRLISGIGICCQAGLDKTVRVRGLHFAESSLFKFIDFAEVH
jgi:hypothetical protein